MTLSDKIKALSADPDDPSARVPLADVLKLTDNAVEVTERPGHTRGPAPDATTAKLWAVMDTIMLLVQEHSIRSVVDDLREQYPALPDVETILKNASDELGEPVTFQTVAEGDPLSTAQAAYHIAEAFRVIGNAVVTELEGRTVG